MADISSAAASGEDEQAKVCRQCAQPLCLRKMVLNLALGNDEVMYCLNCLAEQNKSSPAQVLEGIRDYILGRQCFAKEWVKYPDRRACPDPERCIPGVCFGGPSG